MKIKVNKYCLLLFLMIVLELDCFYLINRYTTYFLGVSYIDWLFLFRIGLVVYTFINHRSEFTTSTLLKALPFGALLLMISSSIAGYLTYGQSIFSGILAQRDWISCMLLFYPIYIWIKRKKITVRQVVNTLVVFAVIYILICSVQYLLIDRVTFLYTNINQRYGGHRLRLSSCFLAIISGFLVDNLIGSYGKRKDKKIFLLVLMGYFFLLAVVTKGRMATLAMVGSITICLLLRRASVSKKIVSIVVVLIGFFVVINSQIGMDALDIVFGSGTGLSADTISVRNVEKEYYLDMVTQSPMLLILGYGYPSTAEIAQSISSPTIGYWTYYTTDVGLVGNLFCYGLLGILWFIILYRDIFVKGWRIHKQTTRTCYLQFFLIDIIGCFSLWPLCFNFSIALPILMAMLDYESNFILEKDKE
ncbi:hypothetical protein [Parasporobacterium paucivorans]|uniref:O-antigen ligase like membrane protein n=1 Tax=Parasporobacterium paucivorans DSM 15970 TaxID=1122934 RepID=A0A1M6E9V5_9FIRM|nr:hypothetical protein [Parasporobacterium paucivorans]SHI82235.1 hypothetical protein SAMN02745691_00902 [Parasporobacterium paucivorans DSM 15970]